MRESVEQVLAAYQAIGLEALRRGQEWRGPCPACGGNDRWHVKGAVDGSVMGCRQCGDFRAIAGALGLGRPEPRGEPDTAAMDAAREATAQRHAAAAQRAMNIRSRCKAARHPYLAARGFAHAIAPVWHGRIAVPVWGSDGLQSMQLIAPDGLKRFLAGGRMTGGHAVIGPCNPRGRRWHVEGLATGLSVRRALLSIGVPDCVVVCFSAGGLRIATDCRRAMMVVDHDWWRCPNKHRWDYPAERCPTCGDHRVTAPVSEYARGSGVPWWQPPEPGDANDFERASGTGALARALKPLMIGRRGWN